MLISFYKLMVNNFCPYSCGIGYEGRCIGATDSPIRPSKRVAPLDLLQNIFCVFQPKYFGVGVNKKGQLKFFLTIP